MKLGKLMDNFSKLTAIEIVKNIASKKITGLWLTEKEYKQAKRVCEYITEEEAVKLLDLFDKERQSRYAACTMYK